MGLISWIIFGALAGWVASMIAGTNQRQGCLLNIVVGVVGAFLGGFIMSFITGANFNFAFNMQSFIVAVLGAVVLLMITGAARKGR
jgi:uncharacterized membrane protein YeaQ/YmgE (transglycosylase-associated protein family)